MAALPGTRQRILIVTDDVLTIVMAGPAIRAWQIASALSPDHDVVLATTSPTCERAGDGFRTEAASADRFVELESWASVIIIQGYVLAHVPVLRQTDRILVVDLYDPLHLETLLLAEQQPEPARTENVASSVRTLGEQAQRGDFFICASEKQRDLWMGFLSAAGRVNPANYDADPSLRRLIDVVAFGLPDEPPEHGAPAIRGVVPGISEGDDLVLWGGGVYDWLDPLTAIEAIDLARRERPGIRLYFLGVRHPNPAIEESRTLVAARDLASRLGLTDRHVFFNEGWVPYERRPAYLLEADVAISLHDQHVETAYSFRTRILDYIWTARPMVATVGDTFADLIEREELGRAVPAGDAAAVASALGELLSDRSRRDANRANCQQVAERFRWSVVLEPLVRFCATATRAADHDRLVPWPAVAAPPVPDPPPVGPAAPRPLYRRVASRLRRLAGEVAAKR